MLIGSFLTDKKVALTKFSDFIMGQGMVPSDREFSEFSDKPLTF